MAEETTIEPLSAALSEDTDSEDLVPEEPPPSYDTVTPTSPEQPPEFELIERVNSLASV
jgi:hypothetical protein